MNIWALCITTLKVISEISAKDLLYKKLNLPQKWLALYIFLVPFMFIPFKYKVQFTEVIFLLLFIGWIISIFKGRVKIIRTSLDIPLILYLGAAALSLVNSEYLLKSFIEITGILYMILLFFLVSSLIRKKEELRFLLYTWMAATSLVVLFGLVGMVLAYVMKLQTPFVQDRALYPYVGQLYRAVSTMRNAKMLCGYLVASAGINLSLFLTEKDSALRRWLGFLFICLCTLTILTFSRDIIGLLICIGFLVFKLPRLNSLKTLKTCIVLALIVFFIIINFGTSFRFITGNISLSKDRFQGQPRDNISFLDSDRTIKKLTVNISYLPTYFFVLKKIAFQTFKEHPFLGSGVGTFNQKIVELKERKKLPPEFPKFDPHSTFFGTLAEAGIFGLGALSILFTIFAASLLNASKVVEDNFMQIMIYGFFASFVGLVVQVLNLDIMNFRFLWLLFGLGMAARNIGLHTEV